MLVPKPALTRHEVIDIAEEKTKKNHHVVQHNSQVPHEQRSVVPPDAALES